MQTRSKLLRGVAAVLAPAHLEVFTQKLHEGIHKFQRIHDDGHSSHDHSKATGTAARCRVPLLRPSDRTHRPAVQ
jgi:hypothetical protein